MKVRNGFVSNSSSSSFVCDVCGDVEGGYDLCLTDAGMAECVNGHTFCECHGGDELKAFLNVEEEIEDENGEWITNPEYNEEAVYYVPANLCPICSFKEMNNSEMIKDIMKKSGLTREIVLAQAKADFKDYKELEAYIKEEK